MHIRTHTFVMPIAHVSVSPRCTLHFNVRYVSYPHMTCHTSTHHPSTPTPLLLQSQAVRPEAYLNTMRSASALFFAALGGAGFSIGGAEAVSGGFFSSSSAAASAAAAARPRGGFLPGWGLPRHESVLDRVSCRSPPIRQWSFVDVAVAEAVVVSCRSCLLVMVACAPRSIDS